MLRIGEQLAQFALAGGAERVGLGGVADKAALDVGEHGGAGDEGCGGMACAKGSLKVGLHGNGKWFWLC